MYLISEVLFIRKKVYIQTDSIGAKLFIYAKYLSFYAYF